MYPVAFHANGRKGAGRADIFAGAATCAAFRIHGRFLVFVRPRKADGSRGTASFAGRAGYLILVDDTERSVDDGSACLDGGFFLYGHGADGPRRADLRTGGAVGPAKAVLERHDRLQHRQTAVSGAQHMIGAGGNAELTAGAMAAEMILADSSRRQDGNGAFGPLPGRRLLSGDLLAVR